MLPVFTMLHVYSFLVSKTLTNNLHFLDHLFNNVLQNAKPQKIHHLPSEEKTSVLILQLMMLMSFFREGGKHTCVCVCLCVSVCVCVSVCLCISHIRLFSTPCAVACQAPLTMEFSRQKYQSGFLFPSSGDLPNPGIKPRPLSLQADSLPLSYQERPYYTLKENRSPKFIMPFL